MKLIHRLTLLLIVALVAVPLVILAQDQPTPSSNDDDLFVPLPTSDDLSDIFVPLPTSDDLSDIFVPLPTSDDLSDIFVPLPPLDTCGNDDPTTIFVPLCPPTKIPTVTPPPPPTQPAPSVINGLWVADPKNDFSSTGQCQSPNNNDNGGPDPDRDGQQEPPTYPVCMTADHQWLSVAAIGTFPLTVAPFYSQQQMRRELLQTNGKTSGSMNVSYTRQYNVISPTQIDYSYIYQETGGCTTKVTFHYTLKEATELVCSGTLMTAMPTFTPVATMTSTPAPGETQQPPVTPPPPVKEGRYIITLPPNDAKCTADKLPQSNAVDLTYDSNQNMFINFGGLSYTLYWDGEHFYQYREGNKFSISMYVDSNGAMFSWKKQGCYVDGNFAQEGAPTPTPVPVEPTAAGNTDTTAIAGNSFSTTFDAQEALCATENRAMLPDLTKGVLNAQADGSFVFTLDGVDYTLANQNGYYVFTKMNNDGSMVNISMNGLYDGKGTGVYTVISAEGKMCTVTLTFTP
jgi:hypothetical protein